ncbi:MAG: phosphoserine phosphatase RsbU/P [Candidatus Poribacteria bacterium]|nr:phosphoserine phosphatase RsbU/P [Candidatus Poribacteria bacterium]
MTSGDIGALSIPPIEQQLETILGAFNTDQRRLLWLSQGKGLTASEIKSASSVLGLPKAMTDQGYGMIGELCELVLRYLKELESSATIQKKLLPEHPPELEGIDISVKYIPMMGVSGDYYDFLSIGKGKIGIALGDVCGKGMSAAMLMACVRMALRAHLQTNPEAVGDLLVHLNKVVEQDAPESRFVTLAYGILDTSTQTFTYSNAGHPPVLHYQSAAGDVRKLNVGGCMLGILDEIEYPAETVTLENGDALVFYTDGIIEASNESEELFGIDRLRDVVAGHGAGSAESLQDAILSATSRFSNQHWDDDVTVMVVKSLKS